jgi:hypothetical protein
LKLLNCLSFLLEREEEERSHVRHHGNVAPIAIVATPQPLAIAPHKQAQENETKTQNKVESDFFFRLPQRRRGKNNVWEVMLKFRFPHCFVRGRETEELSTTEDRTDGSRKKFQPMSEKRSRSK